MIKKLTKIIGFAAFLFTSAQSANATSYTFVNLGGVNLTGWCQSVYGSAFKAKLIQNNAGGWTCEQSAGNRRPISVKAACKRHYGNKVYKAKALNWNSATSWRCFSRVAVPTLKGVSLTPWCNSVYGNAFKAKLIVHNSGGWACEQSPGNRRPILVKAACKLQYGNTVIKAKALNWSDPYSWKCYLK